ncbi:hypothetical protein [Methanobacterium formicicum]|uniref:hypothetical protein n=1 Tax=Methanobacterium formicicum TaxID=2162 RepID=UPI0024913C66|nr:hypothetical protein [Methanobacterium formicicum]
MIQYNEDKSTKIYLKNCRGNKKDCIQRFYTTQANKQYCSAWCRHESVRESWRKARNKQRSRNRLKDNLKDIGTFRFKELKDNYSYLGKEIPFYKEWIQITKLKKETFRTGSYKGKQKDSQGESFLSYQYVSLTDLYFLSTSYLKENSIKCPRCGCKKNIVERGLLICAGSKCGLVLKAPPIHPGFTVPELTPKRKIAATVQDFPPVDFAQKYRKKKQPHTMNVVKEAHDNAYMKYEKETGALFEEECQNIPENNPLHQEHWHYYNKFNIKNKILNR